MSFPILLVEPLILGPRLHSQCPTHIQRRSHRGCTPTAWPASEQTLQRPVSTTPNTLNLGAQTPFSDPRSEKLGRSSASLDGGTWSGARYGRANKVTFQSSEQPTTPQTTTRSMPQRTQEQAPLNTTQNPQPLECTVQRQQRACDWWARSTEALTQPLWTALVFLANNRPLWQVLPCTTNGLWTVEPAL